MTTYKFLLSYDGTDYKGWQQQKGEETVVGVLQDSFVRVFKKKISIVGSSRTDAGVHALGQVARFRTDIVLSADRIRFAWQNVLPKNVVIRSLAATEATFDPRLDVAYKTYYYHVFTQRPMPFLAPYGWYYAYPLNIMLLQESLQLYIGTHNFRAFSVDDDRDNMVCKISHASISYLKRFGVYRIKITGNRFVRHMIRRMVGASLWIASRTGMSPQVIAHMLNTQELNHTVPNAPAHGLMLYKIVYQKGGQ